MKRSMQEIIVETSDGRIYIKQPEDGTVGYTVGYDVIQLHPDQVQIVCDWLEEAKKEICSGRLENNNE